MEGPEVALRLSALLVPIALAACAAPARLSLPRSAMLEAPEGPLTPEGRASPVPSFASRGGAEAVDGEAIAATARTFLGRKSVNDATTSFPEDCTGLLRAVYARHHIDLLAEGALPGDNGVTAIWRYAQVHGRLHRDAPRPGDVVFFAETYDRNRDGRENDGLTHVGVVDAVDEDGTVHVIHRVARGVVSYRMNLSHPADRKDVRGHVVNDWLREGKQSRLAGELFAGYGTLSR